MNKSSTGRLAVALALSGALWVANVYGQFGDQAAKLNLVKVKDDLFVIHNDFVPGNSTALITNEGVILVDDKFEIDHAGILAELKKITDQPVKYVINTHHHADHSGGNAKLQQLNVQVVASVQARENMVDGNQPGLPNMVFDQHARVYLGGKSVDLYHFGRAHTNGDIVALFPASRVLAAGDMFTYGDATPQLIDYAGGGSAKEWTDDAGLSAAARFRYRGPGPRRCDDQAGDAQVPRHLPEAAHPHPRDDRAEENPRRDRQDAPERVPLGPTAPGCQPRRCVGRTAIGLLINRLTSARIAPFMIIGAHILLYSKDPEADRAFFRDVLDFRGVDAGHGWLIFALPASEAAVPPDRRRSLSEPTAGPNLLGASFYLMCDDVHTFVKTLEAKGVTATAIEQQPWGSPPPYACRAAASWVSTNRCTPRRSV